MTFFSASVASCSSSITIKASLAAGTYNCVVIDKFNNRYEPSITVDSYGAILLDLTQFPKSLFTPYSGAFQLMVYNASNNSAVPLTFCETNYDGLSMTFYTGESPFSSIIEC